MAAASRDAHAGPGQHGLASIAGRPAGVLAATRPYSRFDYLLSLATLFGVSMPTYWLGLILIIIFAVQLNWLPAAGADEPASFILPRLTLARFSVALVARMTRASMLEVLGQDYVRTARAKGVRRDPGRVPPCAPECLYPIITAWVSNLAPCSAARS